MQSKMAIILKKVLALTIICIITLSLISVFRNSGVRADSYRFIYNGNNLDTSKYPEFKEKLDSLRRAHPNWTFEIMETDLDWSEVIRNESTGHWGSPKSLIQGKTGDWVCSVCGTYAYDNGSWYHASEYAIGYYMDSRNWINDNSYLFQFLKLDYTETSDDAVYQALNGTFLNDREIAKTINKVCKEQNINPYYVIARIMQEQSTSGSATWKMPSDGKTYYNLFNIGASGNGSQTIYERALAKAKEEGWTSVEKCIIGGVQGTIKKYINNKQNTLYLNKFDVESYNGLYSWQYMQNIEAPKTEAQSMYNKLNNAGLLNSKLTFVIPVYRNMNNSAITVPSSKAETSTKNIRLKNGHTDWNVREDMSTSSNIVGTVANSDTIVISDQRANGWYRVVLTNGKVGYIWFNTDTWEEVSDVTNCTESAVITGDSVRLRAGPGVSEPIVTTLAKGTNVTRIDNTGRYNFGGIIWDRVKLSDGRQGFVSREYISVATSTTNSKKDDNSKIVTMEPNTTYKDIADKKYGTKVTIKDTKGNEVKEGNIGTGYKITIDNNEYTAIKLGDMTGDGIINSGDLLKIVKHIRKLKTLTGAELSAADMNNDGKVDSGDLLKIVKYIRKLSNITL